ncbi:MAG: Nitrogen regulation protein NR(I) [Alphaproteobacteria bacterium MarineAlpha5_Bin6]|mgnify:CR=1 FL=1|nr:MAG: Nitrogen regulation protein NR(I) [Alphaproteobacteria bacterium MarineAlpha5_Bin7]PPR53664.1 MAG: Nitrogen regulation protein NR(I) [Alphaproteobacteria bacterium MarineAlpha5_Bin6]|tara:strand:- start:12 stop:1364 length:1353 start_codon:yes stop_codon:yes gene_type:complete
MSHKVLIIDDEKDICYLISEILKDENFVSDFSTNSADALNKFEIFKPDLVILDVWLGNSELDGLELLKEFKKNSPQIPIIIISGHGTVDMAVNAIKNGAYDFLEKPFNSEKILILSKRALEAAKLIDENKYLKKIVDPKIPITGNSQFIINLKKNLSKISDTNSRILILGPKGSGKKFIAQNIHKNSNKSNSIANIIDLKNLSESELNTMFVEDKFNIDQNIFIKSNNNTLILYNIDFLPINFQKKILNYLENDQYFKNFGINLDVKIIAIISNNIEQEIKKGNFIQNLYNRLNVINIKVPSIDERREDILPICEFYLNYYNKNKKYKFSFSKKSADKLETYAWPGNVRQIINYIEKTLILNQDLNQKSDYELTNLPLDMGENEEKNESSIDLTLSLKDARFNFEKQYFLSQIKRFNGNITKISEFTGMERTALYRKFKSLNITINNINR